MSSRRPFDINLNNVIELLEREFPCVKWRVVDSNTIEGKIAENIEVSYYVTRRLYKNWYAVVRVLRVVLTPEYPEKYPRAVWDTEEPVKWILRDMKRIMKNISVAKV